jgi:hypothetical protein
VDDFPQDDSVWLQEMVEARTINKNNTPLRVFVMRDDKMLDIRRARFHIMAYFGQISPSGRVDELGLVSGEFRQKKIKDVPSFFPLLPHP